MARRNEMMGKVGVAVDGDSSAPASPEEEKRRWGHPSPTHLQSDAYEANTNL